MQQALYDQIQKQLQAGQLSQALDLLVTATHEADKELREDVLLLKSRFEYNRNQYEVKGILSDQEFNIHYSKTLLGAQEALERWRSGGSSLATTAAGARKHLLWPVFAVVLFLAVAAVWYQSQGAGSSEPATAEMPATQPDIDEGREENTSPDQGRVASTDQQDPPVGEKNGGQVKAKKDTPVNTEGPAPVQEQPDRQPANEPETVTPAPPPAKTFEVLIVKNSDMGDAEIYVDGEPALILSNTPIITSIRVTEKQAMHTFELRGDSGACKKEQLITADKQRIIFNCN